jgi:hypothetical protein
MHQGGSGDRAAHLTMTENETQICPRCGGAKPEEGYHRSTWGRRGCWCKQCYRDHYVASMGGEVTIPCEQCWGPIRLTVQAASRRRFCSARCRKAAYRGARLAAGPPPLRCLCCGTKYEAVGGDPCYCSADCRRAVRARVAA